MAKRKCKRCGSGINSGFCSDVTCAFSDHKQTCAVGWEGHPARRGLLVNAKCSCGGTIVNGLIIELRKLERKKAAQDFIDVKLQEKIADVVRKLDAGFKSWREVI